MSNKRKKYFLLLCIILLTISAWFLCRNLLLRYVFDSVLTNKIANRGIICKVEKLSWKGWNRINLNPLLLLKKNHDTLFYADTIMTQISVLSILKNKPLPSNLSMKKGTFLIKDGINLILTDLFMNNNTFSSNLHFSERRNGDTLGKFNSTGLLNTGLNSFEIKIVPDSMNILTLPLWSGTTLSIDSMTMVMKLKSPSGKTKKVEVISAIHNLTVFNKRLSSKECIFKYFQTHLHIAFENDRFILESPSLIKVNEITFNLTGEISKAPSLLIKTEINSVPLTADAFFSSLPPGLFNFTRDFRAGGILSYQLQAELDVSQKDSLLFESDLNKKNFHVKKFGKVNFPSQNEPFYYTGRSKGFPDRPILVGQENPDFVYLENISPYLKNAVLISEDGSFFFHHGFNEEAFRKSIITNLEREKFARGGSTITMQLVKNIYLSREKTISRKLEEILLVWLLENSRAVSKDRLYEIYLNIIEWGPDVFGISEAARFYFAKKPSSLNLQESIFLASIIPRPKNFKYYFDKEGNLREFLKDYYTLVSGKLLKKEQITAEEFENLKPEIKLSGPAKFMGLPQDSLQVDSLEDE